MNLKKFYMGKAIGFVALLIVLGIIGGFYALNNYIYEEKQEGIVVPDFEGEADPSRMTLGMKEWVWISVLYNDERELKPVHAGAFTLTFGEDGKFSATTDCNSMGGTYTATSGIISFSQIFQTKMYCEGSQESEFVKLLENTSGYHFTSRGQLILDLKFDSGSVIFR